MTEEICKLLKPIFGQEVRVQSSSQVDGGSINQTNILHLTNGERVFLKHNSHPASRYSSPQKRKDYKLLSQADKGPRIPKFLALQDSPTPSFLILEYIEKSSPAPIFPFALPNHWQSFTATPIIVSVLTMTIILVAPLRKIPTNNNGIHFFRDHRLRYQQELARKSGKLPSATDKNTSASYVIGLRTISILQASNRHYFTVIYGRGIIFLTGPHPHVFLIRQFILDCARPIWP